jgi:hypothetical protein
MRVLRAAQSCAEHPSAWVSMRPWTDDLPLGLPSDCAQVLCVEVISRMAGSFQFPHVFSALAMHECGFDCGRDTDCAEIRLDPHTGDRHE